MIIKELKQIAITEKPNIIVAGLLLILDLLILKNLEKLQMLWFTLSKAEGCNSSRRYVAICGIVAAEYPSPFIYADSVMTTTHKSLRDRDMRFYLWRKDDPSASLGAGRDFDKKIR